MSSPHLPSLGPGSRLNSVNLTLEMQGDIFEEVTLELRSRDRISYICMVPVSHTVYRSGDIQIHDSDKNTRFLAVKNMLRY